MYSLNRDILSSLIIVPAAAARTITAGSGTDNVAANGLSIDQLSQVKAETLAILLGWEATLANAATLTVAWKLQDSADNSAWADIVVPPVGNPIDVSGTTVFTATSATTFRGVIQAECPLEYCRRYVRITYTADLSAANTDTANFSGMALFGGLSRLSAV
jgi:hypothetical protein